MYEHHMHVESFFWLQPNVTWMQLLHSANDMEHRHTSALLSRFESIQQIYHRQKEGSAALKRELPYLNIYKYTHDVASVS